MRGGSSVSTTWVLVRRKIKEFAAGGCSMEAGWLVALGNWRGKAFAKLLRLPANGLKNKNKLAQMVFHWGAAGASRKSARAGQTPPGRGGCRVLMAWASSGITLAQCTWAKRSASS